MKSVFWKPLLLQLLIHIVGAVDDHCELRKNLMFADKDVEKNTELNNEWHTLIKQAHRDEVSDEIFNDADIAHYVGKGSVNLWT